MRIPGIQNYSAPLESQIPSSSVAWKADSKRAVLLIHDMQNHFLRPFGEQHSARDTMIENICAIRKACELRNVPVFYTAQKGNQDQIERGLQRDFWGPGMSDDGISPLITEALTPSPLDHVLVKHRYSAFKRSKFESMIRGMGRDQLVVVGVYAHIGCLFTAADAFMLDIEPFMVADAVADYSREHHDAALLQASGCVASVTTTSRLLEVW